LRPNRFRRRPDLVAVVGIHAVSAPAASTVKVTESDFAIKPAEPSAARGRVTFVVHNRSAMEHEMVAIRTSRSAAKLPMHGNHAGEQGSVGEVEDIDGGRTKRLTLSLKKGHYALICNVPGHYTAGMHADFTVR
jgi:uncharacterized cupredoxin-like copper-binding protein